MTGRGPLDPWLAAALSMLVPGLGQWTVGRRVRGALWLAGSLGGLMGFLGWILDPVRCSIIEGAGWLALMMVAQFGAWIDAYRLARRTAPPPDRGRRRPEPAAALSILFPGLGQAWLWSRRWWHWLVLLPLCVLPGGLLFLVAALEEPPVGWWPAWLLHWPAWANAAAGGTLSAAAILHGWASGTRAAGGPPRAPALPRAAAGIALAAWIAGLAPWEAWFKDRVVRSFEIPSSSMEPTLLIDDRLWARQTRDLHRGDIVIFRPPDAPGQDYIKRVVGLPGERISFHRGRVSINGRALDEPYTVHRGPRPGAVPSRDEFAPALVPPGNLFLMGDNRDNSRDSRYFGFVPLTAVYGRAYKRFWPPARGGALH